MEPKIDFMGRNMAAGDVAAHITSNGCLDLGKLQPFIGNDGRSYVTVFKGGDPKKIENYVSVHTPQINATLRRDEWKYLDEALLPEARSRLVGVQDLIDNGLTYVIGNGMGSTVLEYHDVSDAMEADLTMDGITRSRGDRPDFGVKYLPLPIIHVDFEINLRVLNASRTLGNALDTTAAEMATRKVAEKLEQMLFTNTSYSYGGGTIYSYVNATNRNLVTLAQNWDASGKTGAEIIADVLSMKQASINDKHFGPWMLYIPTAYETVMDDDYDTTTPGTTIRERILKIDGIKGVKVIDTLVANNVLLVEMRKETVRLVQGMGIQPIEWRTEGGLVTKYKVMTIQVPQIRADASGNSGIVHLSA